ncbi:T9SS type A sorting domain-containing protein, partial [Terrimonas alba]|uniref:T9SS type A sorting domain-containing protein n=1 Tax=Terrimonas alba TaxID=3349636 RepID=UPI0035F389D6
DKTGTPTGTDCNWTVTYHYEIYDDCGNHATAVDITYSGGDTEAPIITGCLTNQTRIFDFGETNYTVAGTEFDISASDNCSLQSLTYELTGATTGNGTSLNGVDLNGGETTITWTATDACGNTKTCVFKVTVNLRPTTLTYTGDLTEQYSDKQILTAILRDATTSAPLVSKTVSFTLGTQSASDGPGAPGNGTDGNGLADTYVILTQGPGSTNLSGSFAGDATYLSSSFSYISGFTITKENADVTYTGLPYFSTASASSCVASITLSATIKDITAVGGDSYMGDIRNATVTFRLGSPAGTILGTPNIPVVLVNTGNIMIGTASTTFNYTLSSTDCANKGTTLDVYAVVNNYYTGDNTLDPGNVTISVPGTESVTGGGYLVMHNSIGTYAGTTGTKTNFGFTMKWTKSGTNPKGQCNIIIRRNGRVYQIKSNAISSLAVNGSSGNFATKANMKDITDPLNPTTVSGNADLFVNMYDGSPGGQLDSISILYQNGSTIIYSSHWNGTQTVRRLLNGGNVQVRQSTPPTNQKPAAEQPAEQIPITLIRKAILAKNLAAKLKEKNTSPADPTSMVLNMQAFPNPTQNYFTVKVTSPVSQTVEVRMVDVLGKVIQVERGAPGQSLRFGDNAAAGMYILEARQAGQNEKTVLKVIKLN